MVVTAVGVVYARLHGPDRLPVTFSGDMAHNLAAVSYIAETQQLPGAAQVPVMGEMAHYPVVGHLASAYLSWVARIDPAVAMDFAAYAFLGLGVWLTCRLCATVVGTLWPDLPGALRWAASLVPLVAVLTAFTFGAGQVSADYYHAQIFGLALLLLGLVALAEKARGAHVPGALVPILAAAVLFGYAQYAVVLPATALGIALFERRPPGEPWGRWLLHRTWSVRWVGAAAAAGTLAYIPGRLDTAQLMSRVEGAIAYPTMRGVGGPVLLMFAALGLALLCWTVGAALLRALRPTTSTRSANGTAERDSARVALVPLVAAGVSFAQLQVFLALHYGWFGVRRDISRYTAYKNQYPIFLMGAVAAGVGVAGALRGLVLLARRPRATATAVPMVQTLSLLTPLAVGIIVISAASGGSYGGRSPIPSADEYAMARWARTNLPYQDVEVLEVGLSGYTLAIGVLRQGRDNGATVKRLVSQLDSVDLTSSARRYYLAARPERLHELDPTGSLAGLAVVRRSGEAALYDTGTTPLLGGRIDVVTPGRPVPGRPGGVRIEVAVTNTGRLSWPADAAGEKGAVRVSGRLLNVDGTVAATDVLRSSVQVDRNASTAPGQRTMVSIDYLPPPGAHVLELDLVREQVSFFTPRYGQVAKRLPVRR